MNLNKSATISLVALFSLSLALVGVSAAHFDHHDGNALAASSGGTFLGGKKPPTKAPKVDNVKVLVKVNGIPAGTKELKAFLQIASDSQKTVSRTVSMNGTNESSAAIMFNKLTASKGDGFAATVNDHIATGNIQDLKKPNKVTVSLS